MIDKKLTPMWVVKNYLPDYRKRYGKPIPINQRKHQFYDDDFLRLNFPDALESFAHHLWDQACREQKEANAPLSIYTCLDDIEYEKRIKGFVARYGGGRKLTENDLQQFAFSLIQPIYEAIYDSIITAPAPEFKVTDKE